MHLLELLDECHSREDLNLHGLKKLNLKKLILKQLMSKLFKFPNQTGCRFCIQQKKAEGICEYKPFYWSQQIPVMEGRNLNSHLFEESYPAVYIAFGS